MIPTILFLLALLFAASGWASPPLALAIGLVFGLLFQNPFAASATKWSRWLLQASVVGLGFGMNLHEVVRAGRSGFVYTLLGIVFAMTAGMALGALLGVQRAAAFLISTGTAICGGSAIAAVGPVAGASDEEMAVSLGTIFVLNSLALLTFPFIGASFDLSQSQFGLWAALAIHDTSSVVGAAAKYGAVALAVATKPGVGVYVSDEAGRAVYVLDDGTGTQVACTGTCMTEFQPVAGKAVAGAHAEPLKADLIGAATLPDGTAQVTYAGKPLYYSTADQGASTVNAQAKKSGKTSAYLVSPNGTEIKKKPTK